MAFHRRNSKGKFDARIARFCVHVRRFTEHDRYVLRNQEAQTQVKEEIEEMTDTGITPLTPAQEAVAEAQTQHEGYLRRDLIGLDQFANVLTGGHPDETISSRAARDAIHGDKPAEVLSKILDVFQKDHGAQAEAGDLERAQAVANLEETSGTLPS